jgi:lambda repressor-like predicted transcriptional regulator
MDWDLVAKMLPAAAFSFASAFTSVVLAERLNRWVRKQTAVAENLGIIPREVWQELSDEDVHSAISTQQLLKRTRR